MLLKSISAAVVTAFLSTAVFGQDATVIVVEDAYVRTASPVAKAGAVFAMINNTGNLDDRLISVTTDAAQRAELHTHRTDGDVMRMMHVEDGLIVLKGETLALKRGGNHVMLMGLTKRLKQGDKILVTFIFENAGKLEITVPVLSGR